ncbi:stemmadenine O-acetyltransferase-like [Solanum dulcamara]|uniref:stemmadenine O-acetyltransferase-like n=1 Tax=Solanum dulcamara TaxID=45834 RepID=UPI0024869AB5|nr:stemmadenine O-acetyltransferase-like [Solanum dulcamara]
MKIGIEIISKVTIKPSSPTPQYLHHYQLSYLDQITPNILMPLIFFYPSDNNFTYNTHRSDQLKISLSHALTKFYPLSGRLDVANSHVNCNDEGVPYVEAIAKCSLSEFLLDPIPNELNKFIPCDLHDVKDFCLLVQANFFQCGGMAIGIAISHKIADALSTFMFINSWGAIARGNIDVPSPRFDSSILFPPRDITEFKSSVIIEKENIVTKRFVFSASKVSALRDKYTEKGSESTRSPSRIEALSAFLWTRLMASIHVERDETKIYGIVHTVNLRTRSNPPLPESLFGNVMQVVVTVPAMDYNSTNEEQDFELVKKVRESIKNINSEFVSGLQKNDQKHLSFIKEKANEQRKGGLVLFNFTSLCRLPLYKADFGWGKPIWVGSASLVLKDVIGFLDTKSGNGIEAWVNLKEEDMATFEADKELLSWCSA